MSIEKCGCQMSKRTKYSRPLLELSDFLTEGEDDASAVQIAQLQDELAHLRDSHKEERYIWVLVIAFLLSCIIFKGLSFGIALLLTVLEISILTIIAKHLGVEYAIRHLQKCDDWLKSLRKSPE